MSKNNIFDFLENSDEGELEMIDRLTPDFSDEQFERILEMSKKKRNKMKKAKERNIKVNSDNVGTVSGVEVYKRPAWIRSLATAASLVIMIGGIAFGFHFMRHSDSPLPVIEPNMSSTSETATSSSDVTTITGTTVTNSQTAQDTTDTSIDETDYKAECEAWVRNKVRKRDEALELVSQISDHIDMKDTFTINIHDESAGPGDAPVISDYTITYAHYINPYFRSLDEMRDFYIEHSSRFLDPDWEYSGMDMESNLVNRYFDTRVQPGDQLQRNSWNKYDIIPLYTEYDGKIYKQVGEDELMQTDAEYWTKKDHGVLWCWAVDNCTEDYFDLYEFYPGDSDSYNSWIISVTKEDGEWVMHRDDSMLPMPEDKWKELCEEYKSKQK